MKLLATCVFIVLSQLYASGQDELNLVVKEFLTTNELSYSKLDKLESIRLKHGVRSKKWKRAFVNWDRRNLTENFDFDYHILSNDSYVSSALEWHKSSYKKGYTFKYLNDGLERILKNDRCDSVSFIFLRNILFFHWDDLDLINSEVKLLESQIVESYKESNLDGKTFSLIATFLQELHPLFASDGSLIENNTPFDFSNASDFNSLSVFLNKNEISINDIEKLGVVTSYPNNAGISVSFSNKSWTSSKWYVNPTINEFVKFQPFYDNEVIRNYFLSFWGLCEWRNVRRENFNKMPLVDSLTQFDGTASFILDYIKGNFLINIQQIGLNPTKTDSCLIQLLTGAYNDIYLPGYFHVYKKVFKCENADLTAYDLPIEDMKTIRIILDTVPMSFENFSKARIRLARAIEESDMLFQLVSFIAFKQRYKLSRTNWLHGNYFTEPSEQNSELRFACPNTLNELESVQEMLDFELNAFKCSEDTYQFVFDKRMGLVVTPELNSKVLEEIAGRLSKLNLPNKEGPECYVRIIQQHKIDPNFRDFANFEIRSRVYPEVPDLDAYSPIPPPPIQYTKPAVTAEIIEFPRYDAQFPGGSIALKKWIKDNLQYPETSRELGDQGRVYITFVVETDGSITGIGVMRGGVTDELNREAKRIIRNMPKWTPGEDKGYPVRTRCRLTVTFKL
jgi:TonB family protein